MSKSIIVLLLSLNVLPAIAGVKQLKEVVFYGYPTYGTYGYTGRNRCEDFVRNLSMISTDNVILTGVCDENGFPRYCNQGWCTVLRSKLILTE